MKHSYIFMILFFGLFSAQKLKVVDSENGKPISHARVILNNQMVYTNEDGFAPVAEDVKDFEISASGYQKKKVSNFNSLIKLTPTYKKIEEIKIVSIDIRKLLKDVSKNYHKRYYSEPSVYDAIYKERRVDNNKLYFLVIAETKLWS